MNIFYHQFSRIQQFFTFFSSFCYYSSFRNSVSVRKSFRVNVSQFVNLHNRIGMYIGRQVQYLQMSPLKLGEEGPISERDRFFISISYSKKRMWIRVSFWGFLLALFHNALWKHQNFCTKFLSTYAHVVKIIHRSTLKLCKHTLRMLFGRPNLYQQQNIQISSI